MKCLSGASEKKLKIVLLGKTGDGKSSAGNTILGENVFGTKASASSSRVKCEKAERKVHGRKITVIDTPGFFDTARDEEALKSDIIKCLIDCAPGVDAFIIVLKVGRYTEHENEVVQKLLKTFREEHVLKHTVILFTHGEQLEGQTIEGFMEDCSQLQELVIKCGGRCHVIDNKYWIKRKNSVKNLLKTIEEMVEENGCFTNELLQKVEKDIQEEMKNISENNLHQEEQREKAKGNVHASYLVKFAGATIGAVIGAFFGIAVSVTSTLGILYAFDNIKTAIITVGAGAGVDVAGAAGGAVVDAGTKAAVVLGAGGLAGAFTGGIIGWNASEEAESVSNAITKAAEATWGNGLYVIKNTAEMCQHITKMAKIE